jgi:hypothetical protein
MKATIPTHLTDAQLLDELVRCAREERDATAVLIAHLAEMDARRLHVGLGFSSLFTYCREVLRLSESATYKRIEVARAARRYPVLLDRLSEGGLNVSTARLIASHLTDENHQELIAAASGLAKRDVEELVARHFPRPDSPPFVRRLPSSGVVPTPSSEAVAPASPVEPSAAPAEDRVAPQPAAGTHTPPRPLATPLSVGRYQIRFTASASTWQKLRVARDLLRHAIPSGDPAEIVDRALTLLIADLTRKKAAAVKAPARQARTTAAGSRHVPANVRREVWQRDQGRCAFVAPSGRRCESTAFLEYHHVRPYGAGGGTTAPNIQLRCQAHNAHEAVLFYGHSKAMQRRRSNRGPAAPTRELAPGPVQRAASVKRRSGRAH